MNVTTTGLDSAPLIPIGATIKRAYWTAPTLYTTGASFETKDLALVHAIEEKLAAVRRHEAEWLSGVASGRHPLPLPEHITIDFRWEFEYPGGKVDLVVQRNTFPTIADAQESLELYRRYRVTE